MNATTNVFVNIIMKFDNEKILKMKTNVFFLSNLEKTTGINNPKIAIVNVNELTYNPVIAIVVLKYSEICDMIPTMLNGVLIASVEKAKI